MAVTRYPPASARAPGRTAWAVAALGVAALAAAEGARLTAGQSQSRALLLPVIVLVALVAVVGAFARPRATFAAAFVLLGVVRVEPAPTDALFILLILAGTLGGVRLRPRVPVPIAVILAAFITVTMLSIASAVSLSAALRFEAITVYLAILAVWLTHAFQDRDLVQLGIRAYIWCAVASSVVSVLALELHLPGGSIVTYANERAMGLFKDPNVFAPYLIPPMAILLEEIGRPRLLGWSTRRNVVLLLVLMGGLLFALLTRGLAQLRDRRRDRPRGLRAAAWRGPRVRAHAHDARRGRPRGTPRPGRHRTARSLREPLEAAGIRQHALCEPGARDLEVDRARVRTRAGAGAARARAERPLRLRRDDLRIGLDRYRALDRPVCGDAAVRARDVLPRRRRARHRRVRRCSASGRVTS